MERRIFNRKDLKTKIFFEDEREDKLFYVWSKDLSLGGLFFMGDLPLRTGSLVFISFNLPAHRRSLRLSAEVVRKVNQGVGVRFSGLNETAKKWIEEFLNE